jgi:OOP family OmpA-OmpF porin
MSSRLFYSQLFGILLIVLILMLAVPRYLKSIPDTLGKKVSKGLSEKQLNWTSVRVNGRDIILSGVAPSIEEHEQAVAVAEEVFAVRSVVDKISPEVITPYTLNIITTKDDIKLDGYMPTKEDKEELFLLIKDRYPKKKLEDGIDIGTGNPASWKELIVTMLEGLQGLDASTVHIVDDEVQISGKIKTQEAKDAFKATLKEFENNPYKINTHIVSMDRPIIVCQEKFNKLLSNQKIKFASNRSDIASESGKVLKELAFISSLCPQAKMVIVGYTDSLGNDEKNKKLSFNRAQAVVSRLFQEGVALERMKASGEGDAKPIADNQTEEGRAKNRRIEFKVIMKEER